jgi:hypothetical protein
MSVWELGILTDISVSFITVLQSGRSHFRFLMRSLNCFKFSNPSSRTMALESNHPLTEKSTSNLRGGGGGGVKGGLCVRLRASLPSVSRLSSENV